MSFVIYSQPRAGSDESFAHVWRETIQVAEYESIRVILAVPLRAVGLDFGIRWGSVPHLLMLGRSLRSLIYFPWGR